MPVGGCFFLCSFLGITSFELLTVSPHDSQLVQQTVEIMLKAHHIIGLSIPVIIALS